MTPAFLSALAKTLGYEGDLVDDPADRGGRTKWGITQRTYDEWRRAPGQVTRPVDAMTDREMRHIYFDVYWEPLHGDELPLAIAASIFDMAVNSGHGAAVSALQRSLGFTDDHVDGVMGPMTLGAAQRASVLPFLKERARLYRDIVAKDPSQARFLWGWMNRLLDQAWGGAR